MIGIAVGLDRSPGDRLGPLQRRCRQLLARDRPGRPRGVGLCDRDATGGSGFIAAWVAGFVFGRRFVSSSDDTLPEFSEASGDLLTMASFFVFGVFLGPVLADLSWQIVVYAVLSLAVVRLIAVAISLVGAKMQLSNTKPNQVEEQSHHSPFRHRHRIAPLPSARCRLLTSARTR